jgi:hypothetical protein
LAVVMKRSTLSRTFLVLGIAVAGGCVGGQVEEAVPTRDRIAQEFSTVPQYASKRVCSEAAPGFASCFARIRVDANGITPFAATPAAVGGLGPPDLQSAYKLDASLGAGATIAIVDAYDDPNAEADLKTYRSNFGLPACTTANGCFKKVGQTGSTTSLPTADSGWAGEIALDLDMASAVCPQCKILLVEASSANMTDLGTAVNRAVTMGATVVSNSYGGSEDSTAPSTDNTYFNHPGVAIFVSSGDSGYGVEYPASSQFVTAVGGTALKKSTSSSRGWIETVWGSASNANGGAGSGCSKYVTKPSYQKDTGCSKRTVADVSAVADPNTGVAVYDTYGGSGWAVYGGTSAASPIVAGIYALTGHGTDALGLPYSKTGAFFDVTSGTNGSCSGSYLCTAGAGFDGPTGVGTPNGAVLVSGGTGGGGGGGGSAGGGGGGGSAGGGGGGGSAGGGGGGGTGGGGGGGGSTCSHDVCTSGSKLVSSCSSCATKICSADSYCCATAWDSQCVSEVSSICGQSCGSGGGGGGGGTGGGGGGGGTGGGGGGGGGSTCSHSICTSGTKLVKGCDPCATSVCNADSYCCSTKWDSICVGEVASVCGQTCN